MLRLVTILGFGICGSFLNAITDKPNILMIFTDDLGWSDLACYGHPFHETPHIDELAASGMRFTDAYAAAPVCSPTRASLFTGKYPAEIGITDWIPGLQAVRGLRPNRLLQVPEILNQLPLETSTIAERLLEAGYATAHIGKWHLGEEAFYPEHHGFQFAVGGHHRGYTPNYFHPFSGVDYATQKLLELPYYEKVGKAGDHLDDVQTEVAIQYIKDHQHSPFYLNLSYYLPHTPLEPKPVLLPKYEEKATRYKGRHIANPRYAAMIETIDTNVGRLVELLKDLDLLKNTLIVFYSDNGGLHNKAGKYPAPTNNYPLRAGKSSIYEGGIRVPLIMSWEGIIEAGSESCVPVSTPDFFATFMELAGMEDDYSSGKSLLPLFKGQGRLERDAIYWHYPHYHSNPEAIPAGAIRMGPYKLIELFEGNRLELYDLSRDISESQNIAGEYPGIAQHLHHKLKQWQKAAGAQFPVPNPKYNPATK